MLKITISCLRRLSVGEAGAGAASLSRSPQPVAHTGLAAPEHPLPTAAQKWGQPVPALGRAWLCPQAAWALPTEAFPFRTASSHGTGQTASPGGRESAGGRLTYTRHVAFVASVGRQVKCAQCPLPTWLTGEGHMRMQHHGERPQTVVVHACARCRVMHVPDAGPRDHRPGPNDLQRLLPHSVHP